MTFHGGKNDFPLLPFGQARAEFAEKSSAGSLQQIEIARVINMIAEGTIGVSDAMLVAKRSDGQCAQCGVGREEVKAEISSRAPNTSPWFQKITIARNKDAVMLAAWIGSRLFR